jgi:hypothetical protein
MSLEPAANESRNVWAWQLRLLPFVVAALSALTLFACIANVVQVYEVERHIEQVHDIGMDKIAPATPSTAAVVPAVAHACGHGSECRRKSLPPGQHGFDD